MTTSLLTIFQKTSDPHNPQNFFKKNEDVFSKTCKKIICFLCTAKQKLLRKSDDEAFQEILKDYENCNDYFMSTRRSKKPSFFAITATMHYCDQLIARKLRSLLQRGMNEFADKELLSKIDNESKIEQLFSGSLKKEYNNLKSDLYQILAARVRMQQDQCMKTFLKFFPSDVVNNENGWKLCLAQVSAQIDPNHIPTFIQEKFSETYRGLPADYAQKVTIWEEQQKVIAQMTSQQLKNWSFSCVEDGFETGEVMNRFLSKEVLHGTSIEEFAESQHYCAASKSAETMRTLESGEIEQFMHLQVEMNLVQQNWKTYRDRLSENEFKAAYDEWGKFSLSVLEFEELLEKECAWKSWRKYSLGSREQFARLFKRWYKENPNQNYEIRCLEVFNAKEIWNRVSADQPEEQFVSLYLDWVNSHSIQHDFERHVLNAQR